MQKLSFYVPVPLFRDHLFCATAIGDFTLYEVRWYVQVLFVQANQLALIPLEKLQKSQCNSNVSLDGVVLECLEPREPV
jgi:hypothetical protein